MHDRGEDMLSRRCEFGVFCGWNTDIKSMQVTQLPIFHGVQRALHIVHGGRNDQPLGQLRV